MKLSIIVPVYKAESYLEKCLDSLVNQSMEDYEIIVINDGSPDNSQKIIDAYREKYPGLIRSLTVENGGQGRARNIGIDMARGDYLGFVDSDDWVSEDMFKTMYEALAAQDGDMAVCDAVKCYDDGRRVLNPLSQYSRLIKIDTSAWNKLIKRELAEGVRFTEGKVWYEDLPFVIKVSMRSKKQVRVHEGLYFYRIGQVSTMNNNNSLKNLDMIKIMEELKPFLLEKNMREEFESLLLNHLLLDSVNRVNAQQSPDKKQVMRSLSAYARENIPHLLKSQGFRQESLNRRIIMYLNYHDLTGLSRFILKAKKSLC